MAQQVALRARGKHVLLVLLVRRAVSQLDLLRQNAHTFVTVVQSNAIPASRLVPLDNHPTSPVQVWPRCKAREDDALHQQMPRRLKLAPTSILERQQPQAAQRFWPNASAAHVAQAVVEQRHALRLAKISLALLRALQPCPHRRSIRRLQRHADRRRGLSQQLHHRRWHVHQRHATPHQRTVHRQRSFIRHRLRKHGLQRAHPPAATCLAVQQRPLEHGEVQGVHEPPPRLGRTRLRPKGVVARGLPQIISYCFKQLGIRGRDDVFDEGAVPVRAQLAVTNHVGAIPDVSPVGGELKISIRVHWEASLRRQRQEAEGLSRGRAECSFTGGAGVAG